jgi:polysaccharide export outer membrane protein
MKRFSFQVAKLILVLTICFPVSSAVAVERSEETHNYRIGVGDLLQVEVYDEPDLTKEVRVLTDGSISFPLLGALKASGLTVSELEQEVTERLAEKYLVNPQVTVFVMEFSRIYVFGEVRNPGSFPLYGKMTVFEAVTLAGGFTEVANPSKVKVIREENGRETAYEVDVGKLTKKGDLSQDMELRARDRVVVPRSFF